LALTAPSFSWAVPTLLSGKETAAYAPPPNETNSATAATTIDAVGRRILTCLMLPPTL
jgi:hypothetical protein